MGLCVYSNGIVEEVLPLDKTFSDNELIESFQVYDSIKSFRLSEIPNVWCIWGVMSEPHEYEYNKLASLLLDEDVYSHIIFIHDSELNIDWNVTDKILYKSYSDFLESIGTYITNKVDGISYEDSEESDEDEEKVGASMIFLTIIGHTADKRVLFSFNPNEQNETFYIDGGWEKFSEKIYDYLMKNFERESYEIGKPFVIYSDVKTIVIIEDQFVHAVINNLINYFKIKEDYEKCSDITNIQNKWNKIKQKNLPPIIDASTSLLVTPRKGRPRKKKTD